MQHTQYFSFCSNLETRSNKHCFPAVMSIWNKCIRKHFTHHRNFIFEFKLFSPSFLLSFVDNTIPVINVFWAPKKFLRWHQWCFQSFSSAHQPEHIGHSGNLHQLHFLMLSNSLQPSCSLEELSHEHCSILWI